eukprot:197218_1
MSSVENSNEHGKQQPERVVITNQYLGEDKDDSTSKHQAAEFSAVEDDDDNNNSASLPNLAGPWHKMPMMGQPAEAGSIGEEIFKKLYGDIPRTERFRVLWLAGILFFIVGGYWLLRSLKDPIVSTIVGVEYIPKCKILSLAVVFCLVFVYNKLIDLFPKHQLFYVVGGFYCLVFISISWMLADPNIGLRNTNASPNRLLGWVSYCAIESFGSIYITLFWAFVNSTMNFDGAKSAYGLIIAGAQVGSILGPTLAAKCSYIFGVPLLYGMGGGLTCLMIVMVWGYVSIFGSVSIQCEGSSTQQQYSSTKVVKEKTGMLEGFRLLLKYDYVKGIFALSCLFMVEVTILDYAMKVLAYTKYQKAYPFDKEMATEGFTSFIGTFGQATNCVSFAFSLLGTSFVVRHLGLRYTLLAFPSLCACAIVVVMIMPTLEVAFFALILIKAFSYSLNNPCKEMLYQPTSNSVKFKSKSWIDIFGARSSKALGSLVTNSFADSVSALMHFGGLVSFLICSFLVYVALLMGTKFEGYMEVGYQVGCEDEDEDKESDSSDYVGIALQDSQNHMVSMEDDASDIVEDGHAL